MLLWVLIVLVLYLLRSVLTFSLTEPVISYAHAALSVLTARLSLHFPAQCSLGPEQFPAGASLRLLLKRQCCQDRQCLAPPMAFPTALLRKRELRCRVTDIYKKALEKTWGASTLKSANGAYLLPSSAL